MCMGMGRKAARAETCAYMAKAGMAVHEVLAGARGDWLPSEGPEGFVTRFGGSQAASKG